MKKLIDFYADWCGPCQVMKPMMERIVSKYKDKLDFVESDVDKNPADAQKYGVMSIPTYVILDEEDKEIDRKMGAMSETQFESWLNSRVG